MVDRKEYFKNVDELIENKSIDRKYFDILYRVFMGEKIDVDKVYLVDSIVYKLFSMLDKEPFIPYKFFDTVVGKVILEVKYGIKEKRVYYVNDIAQVLKISKQAVLKKIHEGDIEARKNGRDWVIEEKSLNEYLVRKGRDPLSKEKLNYYLEQQEEIITPNYERTEIYGYGENEAREGDN